MYEYYIDNSSEYFYGNFTSREPISVGDYICIEPIKPLSVKEERKVIHKRFDGDIITLYLD